MEFPKFRNTQLIIVNNRLIKEPNTYTPSNKNGPSPKKNMRL